MTTYNVKPGDKAEIIYSALGPKGPSVGRIVRIHANNPEFEESESKSEENWAEMHNNLNDPFHYCPPSRYEKEHTVLGKIWPVTDINGQPFIDVRTGESRNVIDVPDKWLRKIVDTPETKSVTDKKELEID